MSHIFVMLASIFYQIKILAFPKPFIVQFVEQ